MDPGTGLTILGSAIGSAKIVEKILGPTAEYLGAGLRDWTEKSTENVGRIFEHARQKLGSRIDSPGAVPPKVLKEILSQGPFSEDALTQEYFGGVLASSRSTVSRDDRGAALSGLVGRLTSYQIRTHFLLYSAIKRLLDGSQINPGTPDGQEELTVFVPFQAYAVAMDFSKEEDVNVIVPHVMFGLEREGLIGTFSYGSIEFIRTQYPEVAQRGLVYQPSAAGVELFLWAHGAGNTAVADFLKSPVRLTSQAKLEILPGIRSTKHLEIPSLGTL